MSSYEKIVFRFGGGASHQYKKLSRPFIHILIRTGFVGFHNSQNVQFFPYGIQEASDVHPN
jgi:hypothetical protein